MRELYNFPIKKEDDPVDKLYAMEDGGLSMSRCFRCRAAGHYGESCTATIWERYGGRRHQIDKCASPADMDL